MSYLKCLKSFCQRFSGATDIIPDFAKTKHHHETNNFAVKCCRLWQWWKYILKWKGVFTSFLGHAEAVAKRERDL